VQQRWIIRAGTAFDHFALELRWRSAPASPLSSICGCACSRDRTKFATLTLCLPYSRAPHNSSISSYGLDFRSSCS
jgi:hypothetical protein